MSLKPKHRVMGGVGVGTSSGFTNSDLYGYPERVSKHSHKYDTNTHAGKNMPRGIRIKQLLLITLLFVINIHYFERIKPYYAIKACIWSNWEPWKGANVNPHHAVLYGDPQIIDNYSYPNRSSLQLSITRLFSDNYLHRNHQIINKVLDPDSILFIGDLFDGGREWEDDEWVKEYHRFNAIFNQHSGVQQFRQIPGNHDIGFGNGIEKDKYSRFKAFYGNADEIVTLGNHSIILMDTVSLSSDNDTINEFSTAILESFQHRSKKFPRIVLSHVPLYRFNELQKCGPLREHQAPFPVMRGKQYQTVLEYTLSQKIVNYIKPALIFSGDDHDYCHVRHPFDKSYSGDENDYYFANNDSPGVSYTDEVTIKSSAMTGGIQKPAIQLLSLWNPTDANADDSWTVLNDEYSTVVDARTATTNLCYLPSPYQPIYHYVMCILFSIFWMFICTVRPDFGQRVNSSFRRHTNNVIKVFRLKKDVQSVSFNFEKKKTSRWEKGFEWLFLDWNIEPTGSWRLLLLNTSIVLLDFMVLLMWYIRSI